MPRPWVENEDGPQCSCGYGTAVKKGPDGQWYALCIAHTPEAGLMMQLPDECQDDFVPYHDSEEA